MVDIDTIAAYRWTCGLSQYAWFKGRRPLGALLHPLNESGELSQWLCHDDSTINIVISILCMCVKYDFEI